MSGRRSSPIVCRYGDFDTLGEHREAQYSARMRKRDERQFARSTCPGIANAFPCVTRPCQLRNPTRGAEKEDRWFTQEPVDLVSDCNLSVSEGGEGLAVSLTHGVINVVKQNGEGLAAQV